MRAATATLSKRGGGGTLLPMPTVSPTQPSHCLTPLIRSELAVGLVGAISGVIGFNLGLHALEYVAVLAAVSGLSLLTARALRG